MEVENPFAVSSEISGVQSSAKEERKVVGNSSTLSDAADFADVAQSYRKTVKRAVTRGARNAVLDRLIRFGESLWKWGIEHAKKALELAANKFVLEFCAMVMTALFAALTKRGYKSMDISTPEFMFRPGSPAPQGAPTQSSRPMDSGNPFTDWSSPPRPSPAW